MKSAIDDGDVAAVETILARDPEAATRAFPWGHDDSTPISYVSLARFHGLAHHNRMGGIARLLLAAGAPPDGEPSWAETPIVTAASYDEGDVAVALIEAGADVVGRGFAAPGGTALAHAVHFGNVAVADVLVAAGAPVDSVAQAAGTDRLVGYDLAAVGEEDRTWALRAAAVCERLAALDLLLDAGADLGARVEGATVLHWAAFFGKPAAVRRLVERGADAGRIDPTHAERPLAWCRFRHRELFVPSRGHDAVEEYLAGL